MALREVWRGRIWTARPVTVVQDSGDLVALYLAIGARWKRPMGNDGTSLRFPSESWTLTDRTWEEHHVLELIRANEPHAVYARWGEDWTFRDWYVNLQEPLSRTPIGFDYMDHMLDIVVAPDLSAWEWKDEEELEAEVRQGLITPGQAEEVRAEGERVVELIRRRASPFSDGWERWRPDRGWTPPRLPEGWDQVG